MNRSYLGLIIFFACVSLAINSIYVVKETQVAVIFQFGEAIKTEKDAGLHFKLPLIQNAAFFDKRVLNVYVEEKELTAQDGKRIVVDAFAKFVIKDPVMFFKTVHNYEGIKVRVNRILESAMRKVIGKVPLSDLLTDERSKLMEQIEKFVINESSPLGVAVIDVRLLKTDLPTENSAAIFRRMQTERYRLAKQIRAEGAEESAKLTANADKSKKIIISEAYMKAEKIKGLGDAESAKLYNQVYSQDNEFFEFIRSLSSYEKIFAKTKKNNFILSTKSKFLKHLKLDD